MINIKSLLTLLSITVMLFSSCARQPFEVASIDVPTGQEFSFCLNKPIPTSAYKVTYYYAVTFITKDKFRFLREGILNSTPDKDNCYKDSKLQYALKAYSDETIRQIENINTSNLDTCIIRIYKDQYLTDGNIITQHTFTSSDFE